MHVLLPVIGTAGDAFPFIGAGAALVQRGHRVTVIANDHFEAHARQLGMEFLSLGTDEEYRRVFADPAVWHWRDGLDVIVHQVMKPAIAPVYEAICANYVPGQTVVACSGLTLGVMAAHEKTGVPSAMLVVSPMALHSVYDAPIIHPLFVTGLPPILMRLQYWLTDRLVVDRVFGKPFNEFRATVGLKPLKRVWDCWTHSFDTTIGLFPEWFAPIQPDWPRNTHLTGFVMYDGGAVTPPSDELVQFLESGERPIVFTAGSAMLDAQTFFEESAKACQLLGKRGLLMTPFPDQVPDNLPEGVIQAYAPFSWLLPRVAAIVHHGGIGTMARSMKAGIPQLAMPMAYDQPDNARRLKRLGIGGTISRKAFLAPTIAQRLRELMESPEVARACRDCAERFARQEDPMLQASLLIERLGQAAPSVAVSR